MDLIFIPGLLSMAVAGAAYGIPLYFYGRYISKTHPNLWKQLGSPSLTTAQGPRRDRLSEWISKERYLNMADQNLVRRGRMLRKLQRFSYTYFMCAALCLCLGLILRQLT